MLYITVPFPLPSVVSSVNHDASFATVQDVFEVTTMYPLIPPVVRFTVFGEIESEGVAPACVTVQT